MNGLSDILKGVNDTDVFILGLGDAGRHSETLPVAFYSVPKFRTLTELFRRNSVFFSFRRNLSETELFRSKIKIPWTQNIDHKGPKGSIYRSFIKKSVKLTKFYV